MKYQTIQSIEKFNRLVDEKQGVLFYFSHEACNVCNVLKPKIMTLFKEKFPLIERFYADTIKTPQIPAQLGIFAVPTIILYFEGREYIRESRNISLNQLKLSVERAYSLLF